MELYLNEIFLGYRSYGVAAAAYNYFGKSLSQLNPDEAAFLAALPKGPNNYHPKRHPEAALGRRNWVLGEMNENGFIDAGQLATALARPLATQDAPRRAQYADADFFVEEARRQAIARFGQEQVNRGGYYLRTTLDPTLQSAARDALMRGLENYDRRHGWRGPWGRTDFAEGWRETAVRGQRPGLHDLWQFWRHRALQQCRKLCDRGRPPVRPAGGRPARSGNLPARCPRHDHCRPAGVAAQTDRRRF